VILMDMMMPEVDGLAATRAIRAGPPPRCHTLIVGLTANTLPSDRAACEAAGMNGFVTKPVTMERLRAALEQTTCAEPDNAGQPTRLDAPILDTAFLEQLATELDAESVAEMIRVFLEDAPDRMAAIQRAAADGAVQIVRREAHALAGAAWNVGLTRLGKTAGALQSLCERAEPGGDAIEAVAIVLRDSSPLAAAWAARHEAMATSGS
jgi:two-component system, sensor histidine kinase and response regulator